MEERLVELEERYTLLAHQLEQLDGVVLAQAREIDALTREVATLREAMVRLAVRQGAPRDDGTV
jgi:uncharacterized coiled-coil protein SlyX